MSFLYDSLPVDALAEIVPVAIPAVKIVMLGLIASKWESAKYAPFTKNVFQFAAMGAICKIAWLQGGKLLGIDDPSIMGCLEDLSFAFPLIGVIVTTGLDFLWALSTSMEANPIFHRSISENDFVKRWSLIQIPLVAMMASIRFVSDQSDWIFPWTLNAILVISFGFIWYCLWKVHGSSTSPTFVSTFNKTVLMSSLLSFIVVGNVVAGIPLIANDIDIYLEPFLVLTHTCETVGIFSVFFYFAYLKAPPSGLKDHLKSWEEMRGIIKARTAFKRGLNKKKD